MYPRFFFHFPLVSTPQVEYNWKVASDWYKMPLELPFIAMNCCVLLLPQRCSAGVSVTLKRLLSGCLHLIHTLLSVCASFASIYHLSHLTCTCKCMLVTSAIKVLSMRFLSSYTWPRFLFYFFHANS